MNNWIKMSYILGASLFIEGLVLSVEWSRTPKLIGFSVLLISLLILYFTYALEHQSYSEKPKINLKRASLGVLLIIIDISYNLIKNDEFRYFDYGMILSGLGIILLNTGPVKFLKMDEKMIAFCSYFIFITLIIFSILFPGMNTIFGGYGEDNPIWNPIGMIVVKSATPVLNLIRPTTTNGKMIDFDNFRVSVNFVCTGIESISVFFSAVLAFFIAKKERNFLKMGKYILIGGIALWLMNLLRVIMLVNIGYFFGADLMLFVHTYLGWILFVAGMAVFWYLVVDDF